MCGTNCDLPIHTLTNDSDEQNSAVNGQRKTLQSQLLLLNSYCTNEDTKNENYASSPLSTLCEVGQNKLHQFTQKISIYVSVCRACIAY